MKRIIAILIVLVYLPAMAGVSFNTHYCGGKWQGTKVFSFGKDSCCSDDPEEDECCSDQLKFVKLEKDQFASGSRTVLKQFWQPIYLSEKSINKIIYSCSSIQQILSVGYVPPPLLKKIPILYCSFLI